MMYSCPFCFESYGSIPYLKGHCKVKHCSILKSSFQCRQKLSTEISLKTCPRTFCDIYSFFKHLYKSHSINSTRDIISRDNTNIQHATPSRNYIEDNIYRGNTNLNIVSDSASDSSIEETDISSQLLVASCAMNNTDNILDVTVEEFANKIAYASSLFVASLYARPSLPRVFCQEIICSMKSFLNFTTMLEKKYNFVEPNAHEDLNAMFHILINAFSHYSSEYQTILYFKTLKFLIEPQEICIDAFIDPKLAKSGKNMLIKNRKICIVPLEKILIRFLELPNVYNKIVLNIKDKEEKETKSLFKSNIWHSVKQRHKNQVLPLILYYDELEINNPLDIH